MDNIITEKTVKPKRKYTRKNYKNIDITLHPERPVIPLIKQEIQLIVKPKRKYTRRKNIDITLHPEIPVINTIKKPISVPIVKPKRKYTRKLKIIEKLEEKEDKNITDNIIKQPMKKVSKLKIKTELEPVVNAPLTLTQPIPPETMKPVYFEPEKKVRLNESLVELMDDLSFIMRKRKDMMRARAYNNAKETIQVFEGDIVEINQLKGKPGIGNTIYQKMEEYTKNGTLKILEEEKENILKRRAMEIFTNIYGVGEKKAEDIINKGITTLEELRQKEMELLNDKQRIGLKYFYDILERIPRNEIVEFEKIFKKSITNDISDLKIQIVGSYRRGLSSSGDIDVIITSENPTHFSNFIDNLLTENIILEVLSRGSSKCLVIAKIPGSQLARRVDFLYTSTKEFPFSILYFTGSKEFNTAMREHALSMQYTLNEHGLSYMVNKTKKGLVEKDFPDEKSIFDFLNLQYKNPEERTSSKAVVLLTELNEVQFEIPVIPSEQKQNIQMEITENNIASEVIEKKPEIITIEPIKPKIKTQRITKKKEPKILESEPPAPSINIIQTVEEDICKKMKKSITQNIINFKMKGVKVLDILNETDLSEMLEAANTAFHCTGKPLMTDAEYDILHEYIEKRFPKNPILENVGAPVQKNKAVLPYEMWSMDKIKPDTNALDNWKAKYTGPYVISCKLDGISVLYSTEGEEPKMYTRGNGKIGEDISYLIPYIKLPKEKNLVIRGEFVVKRQTFEEKYKEKFANARNMVAGIVNKKNLDKKIYDVDFVAYEVIKPDKMHPSKQLELLSTLNIISVQNKTFSDITNETLSNILQEWRTNYIYDIDGIIVSNDAVYPRISGNPEHSFAFKMVLSDQIAETLVIGVEWNTSKDGYLKPRVHLEPIKLGGVTIEYATGFNADFISKNKIGVGAIVKIIRSGDVIPYIKEITQPAENVMMPSVPYRWNDTHIDIILENVEDDINVREKQITSFFKVLSVDGIGPGNVRKIMQAGFNTIPKILHMTESDFLSVDGFQQKMATKLIDNIQTAIDRVSIIELMAASNKFGRGFGIKKIESIIEVYPNVLKPEERNIEKIAAISGMSKTSAQDFVDRIPQFLDFMRECGLEEKLIEKMPQQKSNDIITEEVPRTNDEEKSKSTIIGTIYNMFVKPKEIDKSHPLYGKSIVISGFTDKNKELENKLKFVGTKLGSSVSKKTAALIVKSEDEHTGKWLAATENNVPIYTIDNFMKKFFQKEGIEEKEHPV